jgi:hypothetical protein
MSSVGAEVMSSKEKSNPYDNDGVRAALEEIVAEGRSALTKTPESTRDNVDALVTALLRAIQEPGCEIRLTYKTTAEATCAWTWMVSAAKKNGLLDQARCSAFDVELVNGSGIMFWTDEGRPETEDG